MAKIYGQEDGLIVELGIKRVEDRVEALDRLTEAKFVTYKTMLEAQAAQVAIALEESEKAITKAEGSTEKRFEAVNEFRASLTELSSLMATRRELETAIAEIKATIAELSKQASELRSRLDIGPAGLAVLQGQYASSQGVKQGTIDARSLTFVIIGIVIAIIGLAASFFK